jgi:hypothetical protein
MLTDQELQRLRNQANECEQAADEIVELRAERDALLLDRQQRAAPSAEPVAWMYDCGGGGRMYADELSDPTGWLPLYTAPPDHTALLRQALDALDDMYNGWRYIRESHGDLYGVGWDRAKNKASAAIDALRAAMEGR